ncbi:superoxide dismutase family protein [Glycomyces paridis]|uniref:Uncharacterized protein n=1 Tax=Glycomyces paridis TaxID=2126555 RepID=A0A4S8PKF9_9ACTN|nr:superoxide dismutase family protein [Glycomyces paridis]THV31220.1 hypothetical protein E9998_02255 [Glycomyces paridis]
MPLIRAAAAAAAAVLTVAAAGCGSDAEDDADLGGAWTASLGVTAAWAEAAPRATGTAEVSSGDGTSVQLSVTGLEPGLEYTAHVHDGECDEDPPGGGHWLADASGEDAAGNIVQLTFTTSESGTGATTASVPLVLDDRAESVVVHAPEPATEAAGLDSDRVLCGDLEEN